MAEYELTLQEMHALRISCTYCGQSWRAALTKQQIKKFWNYLNEPCTEHYDCNWTTGEKFKVKRTHRYLCPECIEKLNKELN